MLSWSSLKIVIALIEQDLKKKTMQYSKLDIEAKVAVLPHYLRSAIKLFIDDSILLDKSKRLALTEAMKLYPDIDRIMNRIFKDLCIHLFLSIIISQ